MVRVKPHLCTRRLLAAPDAHLEGPLTADAELELALRAREVHAAAERKQVAELARRAGDAVLGQLLLKPRGLVVGIVVRLPLGEIITAYALVSLQPLRKDKQSSQFSVSIPTVHFIASPVRSILRTRLPCTQDRLAACTACPQ